MMELTVEYTKSALDWIGNIFTVLIMLPIAIVFAILLGLYFLIRLPFWWLNRKIRHAAKKI
jgi:hypothetical protein